MGIQQNPRSVNAIAVQYYHGRLCKDPSPAGP